MMEPDRMRLTRVRSPQENEVGVLRFLVRARRAARSQDGRQTDDRGSVSGPVTAIDVVVAEHLPRELRREEVDLVGRLRAAEDSSRRPAVRGQAAAESIGGTIERFVPGTWSHNAVFANQRLRQSG